MPSQIVFSAHFGFIFSPYVINLYCYWYLSCVICRWQNIQRALDEHRRKLDGALEVHAFNRDVDDINDRINEKVSFTSC